MTRLLFRTLLCLCPWITLAQQLPVGSWKEYLPYRNAIGVCQSDNKIYCITGASMFSVDKDDYSMTHWSKINGLTDIGFSAIRLDPVNQVLVIAYSNSNIDLFRSNGIINVSDIKRRTTVGDKSIYNISFHNNLAYLSCGFGIVVLDLSKNEIYDTYHIGPGGTDIKVNQVLFYNNLIYAATAGGIYYADPSSPNLADFNNWHFIHSSSGLPAKAVQDLTGFNGNLYAAMGDSLLVQQDTSWSLVMKRHGQFISSLAQGNSRLLINLQPYQSNSGGLFLWSSNGTLDSLVDPHIPYPEESLYDEAHQIYWTADLYNGLCQIKQGTYENLYPNGPTSTDVFDLNVANHQVMIAPGSLDGDGNYAYNHQGFFIRSDMNYWSIYNQYNTPALDTFFDFVTTTYNPVTHKNYFGSFGGGLVELGDDNTMKLYKSNSSLTQAVGDHDNYRVHGLAADQDGNLWVSNAATPTCINVLKPDGTWKAFLPTLTVPEDATAQIVIDQNNYKWIVLARSHGILVFDSGADPDNTSDDHYRLLTTGVGSGNLPSNAVNCLAVDKNGTIWVGTDAGVAVFYCASNIFSSGGCDAQQILVKTDAYYGYLLFTENVTSIAVDGADRKWIGTGSGVYEMSEDGTQQLQHLTTDNSPLFSNNIDDICIDGETGEVYIGTDKGLMVYRGDATEAKDNDCSAHVFPNPVREDYSGDIAISNLPYNCEVIITDVSGHLVYKTTSHGGQANWNGTTAAGNRVSTGVYYVFAADNAGTTGCVTKVLVVH